MTDEAVQALARRAGIALRWRDYADKPHRVSIETARRILGALGLPCSTAADIAHSERQLESSAMPPLITAPVGAPIDVPIRADQPPASARIVTEDGATMKITVRPGPKGAQLSGVGRLGYHILELGKNCVTLAVAPPRCLTIADVAPNERLWGLAVQAYGLRSPGDCGIGDMAGVIALARQAAELKADALALSPMHALFTADPHVFSPYSPSSRLFYNSLHADPRPLFGGDRVQKAAAAIGALAAGTEWTDRPLINWPQSANLKVSIFRRLFEDFASTDLASGATPLATDFRKFCDRGGALLHDHAVFEALHAKRLAGGTSASSWREWPARWRTPNNATVKQFARDNGKEVLFHCFLQWIADRSLATAQQAALQAGMRIGLIADLAVGMRCDGSHAWTSPQEILTELEIGAPPDLYNRRGQNWGVTTYSPRALVGGGFASFIATLRAAMRHAGGVRVDHAMGLLRLWVIPRGADPHEGAYLTYPIDDLLRLTALESHRHAAIVIGEDLGTVPAGFRERLSQAGAGGMRVLWFERRRGRFLPPQDWTADAVAMTSTHDLPTIAGWWRGHDIDTREQLDLAPSLVEEKVSRQHDRQSLWRSFREAKAADGDMPPAGEPGRAVAAALKFVAQTRSDLALVPLEDVLGLEDQPNLPGTIDEHPNWRHRYPAAAADLLSHPESRRRIEPLTRRGGQ